MNGAFNKAPPGSATALPMEFAALCPAPLLLPGESLDHYRALQAAIFHDLSPRSAVEWLLAIDFAELSWEIQRYRLLQHKILEAYRQEAIEVTLRRIDVLGIPPDFRQDAEFYTSKNALAWRLDPVATEEIEARLASYGFDQHAINMEAYVQAREVFSFFESLLKAAQLRRLILLKDINNHRGLATQSRHGPARGERQPMNRGMSITSDSCR